MTNAPIYKQNGDKKEVIQLPENLFTLPWADELVHQVVVGIASNQRAATAHTKARAEVRGGGRKPWRQKGTDRARHGSIRSPLWVGGGVTFGPSKEKKYNKRINKKMRTKAFFTVLSQKLRTDSLAFIDNLTIEQPSTKTAVEYVKKICGETADKKKNICTIIFTESDTATKKSFANIQGVQTIALDAFNVRDALRARMIFFVNPKKTLEHLNTRGEKIKSNT